MRWRVLIPILLMMNLLFVAIRADIVDFKTTGTMRDCTILGFEDGLLVVKTLAGVITRTPIGEVQSFMLDAATDMAVSQPVAISSALTAAPSSSPGEKDYSSYRDTLAIYANLNSQMQAKGAAIWRTM